MPLTIGLTGGIASGKTLVAHMFEQLGVPVLDADSVSREIVAPPSPVLNAIAREFGGDFIQADATLDRRRLREHVFADDAARRKLERITHPAIRERLLRWRDTQTAPYCILAVAILIESGMNGLVHRVLVVDASAEMQTARLKARDGIGETLARQMLAAQISRAARLTHADDVLENTGSREQLQQQVLQLHAHYLNLPVPGR